MPTITPPTHPLLSTTYHLHRLSPLYNFPPLDPAVHPPPLSASTSNPGRHPPRSPFKPHERALTNLLRGEVLRGVTISTDPSGNITTATSSDLAKAGRFKACKWRLVPTLAALREWVAEIGASPSDDDDDDDDDEEEQDRPDGWDQAVRERNDVAGVEITFEYERGVGGYVAYLIGHSSSIQEYKKNNDDSENKGTGFTYLPLVLTRLPKPLMELLFGYLSTTFDTLPLPLNVISTEERDAGTEGCWIASVLEMYLYATKGRVCKDVTLSFRIPKGVGNGVKTITVGIGKEDVRKFLEYGRKLLEWENGLGSLTETKKRKREDRDGMGAGAKGPFLAGLGRYMHGMMGIEAKKLVLTKVACGGFVVGGSGGSGGGTGAGGTKGDVTRQGDQLDVEAMGSSGRVKMFVPTRARLWDDDEDDEVDTEGRSGEEVAAEKFLEELVMLAGKKAGVRKREGDANVNVAGMGLGVRRKQGSRGGKIPRGRIEIS